jgi:hypothetical protein
MCDSNLYWIMCYAFTCIMYRLLGYELFVSVSYLCMIHYSITVYVCMYVIKYGSGGASMDILIFYV